jgi:hypothetical protein
MKETTKNRWITGMKILAPIIVIFILFGTALQTGIVTINSPQQQKDLTDTTEIKATVILNFGNNTNFSYSISTVNATVYGCLLEAATIGNFNVKTTYYPSFDSTLIDAIGNATGGKDNKYWQYYVNGIYGTLGVDKQTVHDGDRIEWKFAEFSS